MNRLVRRRSLVLAVAASVMFLTSMSLVSCAPPPTYDHVLDQENTEQFEEQQAIPFVSSWTCDGDLKGSEVAQSFVAGITGDLVKVSLVIWKSDVDARPLEISIRTLRPDGAPSDTVLGSGSFAGQGSEFDPAEPAEFTRVWLSQPAPVVAGQLYAIVANTSPVDACVQPSGWFLVGSGPTYSDGNAWSLTRFPNTPDWYPYPGDSDLWFKTWVVPA